MPVGPGVHEIFRRFERGAGIELAPRAFDVAARRAPRARSLPASTIAPASLGRAIGAIGARGENRARARRRAAAARSRSARCVLRPPRPCAAGSVTVDSPPHTSPSADGGAQRRDEGTARPSSASPSKRVARRLECRGRAPAPRLRPRATAARRSRRRCARRIGHRRQSRPNNPEPMTSGSSPGTSEMNSASARASAEQPRDATALEAREPRAFGIERGDVPARGEPALVERAQSRRATLLRAAARPGSNCRPKSGTAARRPRAGSRRVARVRRRPRGCAHRAPGARSRDAVTPAIAPQLRIDVTVLGDDAACCRCGRRAHRARRSAMALAALPIANTATGVAASLRRAGSARRTRGRRPRAARRRTVRGGCGARSWHRARAPASRSALDDLEAVRVAVATRALARSERSDCRRARYSGVTSPVT